MQQTMDGISNSLDGDRGIKRRLATLERKLANDTSNNVAFQQKACFFRTRNVCVQQESMVYIVLEQATIVLRAQQPNCAVMEHVSTKMLMDGDLFVFAIRARACAAPALPAIRVMVLHVSCAGCASSTTGDATLWLVAMIILIREGSTEDSPLVGTYCGSDQPTPYTSIGNELLIVFHTDATVTTRGFKLKYKRRCGGILRNNSGIINTALSTFFTGDDCSWIISAPAGKVIRLNWNSFTIQMSNEQCESESVTVFDNSSTTPAGLLMGRYCTSITPPTLTTIGNLMTIKLKSVSRMSSFSASYTFVPISQICGGTYYVSTGVLRSPLYPSHYPHNLHCVWVIEVPVVQKILLNITDFELEADNNCQFDFLEIRNGGSALSPLIGQFCGNSIPRTITSFSQSLYLLFHTDSSVNRKGFSINWDGAATGCGGRITSPTGTIHSPNYPNSYVMNMENGGSALSPLIGQFCGNSIPRTITSFSQSLYLLFHTDSSVNRKGFSINWDGAATGCGGRITSPTGTIHSPNYPNSYVMNMECYWKIVVSRGSLIQLIIVDLDLEHEQACKYDYIELRDGPSATSPIIGQFCHRGTTSILTTTQNFMWIKFRADESRQGRGFNLQYETNPPFSPPLHQKRMLAKIRDNGEPNAKARDTFVEFFTKLE
ncbi:hypothetical protein B566_EDAN014449, partial [Ephemera danica]